MYIFIGLISTQAQHGVDEYEKGKLMDIPSYQLSLTASKEFRIVRMRVSHLREIASSSYGGKTQQHTTTNTNVGKLPRCNCWERSIIDYYLFYSIQCNLYIFCFMLLP